MGVSHAVRSMSGAHLWSSGSCLHQTRHALPEARSLPWAPPPQELCDIATWRAARDQLPEQLRLDVSLSVWQGAGRYAKLFEVPHIRSSAELGVEVRLFMFGRTSAGTAYLWRGPFWADAPNLTSDYRVIHLV